MEKDIKIWITDGGVCFCNAISTKNAFNIVTNKTIPLNYFIRNSIPFSQVLYSSVVDCLNSSINQCRLFELIDYSELPMNDLDLVKFNVEYTCFYMYFKSFYTRRHPIRAFFDQDCDIVLPEWGTLSKDNSGVYSCSYLLFSYYYCLFLSNFQDLVNKSKGITLELIQYAKDRNYCRIIKLFKEIDNLDINKFLIDLYDISPYVSSCFFYAITLRRSIFNKVNKDILPPLLLVIYQFADHYINELCEEPSDRLYYLANDMFGIYLEHHYNSSSKIIKLKELFDVVYDVYDHDDAFYKQISSFFFFSDLPLDNYILKIGENNILPYAEGDHLRALYPYISGENQEKYFLKAIDGSDDVFIMYLLKTNFVSSDISKYIDDIFLCFVNSKRDYEIYTYDIIKDALSEFPSYLRLYCDLIDLLIRIKTCVNYQKIIKWDKKLLQNTPFIVDYYFDVSVDYNRVHYTLSFRDVTLFDVYKSVDDILFSNSSTIIYHRGDTGFYAFCEKYFANNEQYLIDLNNANKEYKKLNKDIRSELFVDDIKNFITDLATDEINSLSYHNDIHITPYIMLDSRNPEYVTIKIKIGRTKEYVVKNLFRFFSSFKSNEEVSYGKDLTFIHNDNALDDVSKEFVKLFLDVFNIYNNDDNRINLFKLHELIKIYKDSYIYINEEPYYIQLSPIPFKMIIDENFEIGKCTPVELNNVIKTPYAIYTLSNSDYTIVIKNKKHVTKSIDYIDCNPSFVDFTLSHIDFNIEKGLNEFTNEVYARFSDHIDIDQKVMKHFKLSEVTIKSYFDIENYVVTCVNEYYIGNVLKEEKDLSYLDKKKISKYLELLYSIGFDKDDLTLSDNGFTNFLTLDFGILKRYAYVYLSEKLNKFNVESFSLPTIKIKREETITKVLLDDIKYSDVELYQILDAIKTKKKFIELKDDRIILLNFDGASQFSDAIEELGINKKSLRHSIEVPLYKALKLKSIDDHVQLDDYLYGVIDDIASFKRHNTVLPTIDASLRKYQVEGYNWLKTLSKYNLGGILADDMGLGKTLQVITLLASCALSKPSLIACPKSLILNWKSEFIKFANYIDVECIYGNSDSRKSIINSINPNIRKVYITSYDSLRIDIDEYKDIDFNYFIIDEAQTIKNQETGKSKAVKLIKSQNRFALTGTPIENSVLDLWSLFDFLMPNFFESHDTFLSKYDKDINFQAIVKKKITPFILRRTKKEVLTDLPPKYETLITVEMDKDQHKLYQAFLQKAKDSMFEENSIMMLLGLLTRLRQVCVSPRLIDDTSLSNGKVSSVISITKERLNDGHRILIFSQFVKALELLRDELNNDGIDTYMLTGQTKIGERLKLVEDFNSSSSVNVFLISLKAGGNGLNLTGADTVIHVDPWWNVATENQATDRTHRIGQTKNVEVIKLICEDSIEQRVIELQNLKKDLIDKLISDNDESITKLSKEDMAYILK